MSKIQITITHTIDRTTSVHDDKAIRCGQDCFHCSRQYGECDLFPFSKREYHKSDNTWSPCQACLDAERKAEEQKGYSELMAIPVKENDELQNKVDLSIAELGGLEEQIAIRDKMIDELIDALKKLSLTELEKTGWTGYYLYKYVSKIADQALAKHKETKG